MTIDIVIATANNIEQKNYSLYYTIRSILSQTYLPKRIIIVENGDFDKTNEKLNEDFGEVIFVVDGTKNVANISYARNFGASFSKSDILLFMDDDVVMGRNECLKEIAEKMQYVDFYCGAHRFWTQYSWPKFLRKSYSTFHVQNILRAKSFLPKSIERLTGKPSYHEFSFIGHFGAIKKNVFMSLDGFDETYTGWTYQDTDLMMRLCVSDFSFQLMHNDNIYIYHLSHGVDKSSYVQTNRDIYLNKQQKLNVRFHLNHFFGIFDDSIDCSILTDELSSQN